MKLLLLLSLLVLLSAVHALDWFEHSEPETFSRGPGRSLLSSANDMKRIAKSISRNTYHKSKASNYDGHVPRYGELCEATDGSNSTPVECWITYGGFLGVLVTAGLILAVLTFGSCCIFFSCIRYPCFCRCLGTCGSRVPSKGICVVKPHRFTGYKQREVTVFKYLLIGFAACVMLLCIPLFVGEGFYLTGVSLGEADDQASIVVNRISSVLPPIYESPLLKLAGGTTNVNDLLLAVSEFNFYTNQFSELLPIISKDVSLVVKITSIPFWIIVAGIFLIGVLAICAAFIPALRLFLYAVAITAFLWAALFFIIFAWYFMFGIAVADVCKYAEDSLNQDQSTTLLRALDNYCIATYPGADTDSTAQSIYDSLVVNAGGLVNSAQCFIYDPTGSPDYFPCANPEYVVCSGVLPNCTNSPATTFLDSSGNSYNLTQCAASCQNATLRRFANNILGIQSLVNDTNQLIDQLTPILYCSFYIDRIEAVRKDSCKNILTGCIVIFVTSPIMAVFCLGLFIVAIMAVKRLNVDNQIIEASGMEMESRTRGSSASPSATMVDDKPVASVGKPKLEPEIVRTMRDREMAASAVAANAVKPADMPVTAPSPRPSGAGTAVIAPAAVAYPNPSPPDSRDNSELDYWPDNKAPANADAPAPMMEVSEPPPAYDDEPHAWQTVDNRAGGAAASSLVSEPEPFVAAPAVISPRAASPGASDVSRSSRSRSASGSSRSGSGSSSSGSGSRSGSGSVSGSVSRSASVASGSGVKSP